MMRKYHVRFGGGRMEKERKPPRQPPTLHFMSLGLVGTEHDHLIIDMTENMATSVS